ncbi:glycosyltransferase family 2 protein [Flavobacterium sp. FZUC8N2.13]|uniref:Glycosyltransferase family 2 protein n=1 Tax=Flavobacterium zubiriense TaxID=3138075 RepID=A0ABV4T9D5_9FLAO
MQASVLIVSKDRKSELKKTLLILEKMLIFSSQEVLVFLDGCTDDSEFLKEEFKWVKWFTSDKSIGASRARAILYPNAMGTMLIGLDDDAHPLSSDFVIVVERLFKDFPNVGILTFQEIKGVFVSDEIALNSVDDKKEEYITNDFIGCGFAIRKEAYEKTNGFPVWMDIYGEESCVAIEVISKGYDILYSNAIKVNHRVDKEARKYSRRNYFRFEKQLKNSTAYYIVYYQSPIFKIMKLYWHNFRKYALKDMRYFKLFFKVILEVFLDIPRLLKYRRPIDKFIIDEMKHFTAIKY